MLNKVCCIAYKLDCFEGKTTHIYNSIETGIIHKEADRFASNDKPSKQSGFTQSTIVNRTPRFITCFDLRINVFRCMDIGGFAIRQQLS